MRFALIAAAIALLWAAPSASQDAQCQGIAPGCVIDGTDGDIRFRAVGAGGTCQLVEVLPDGTVGPPIMTPRAFNEDEQVILQLPALGDGTTPRPMRAECSNVDGEGVTLAGVIFPAAPRPPGAPILSP